MVGYHFIQSFAPGEVTPEQAHRIGMAFAEKLFGGQYEAVIGTHLDKAHLHNHIVVNSVSFVDGRKYHSSPGSYYFDARLQYWSGLVQHDEERLLKRLLNATDKGQAAARKKQAAELKKAEKRKAEVDTLFARMYEDWAAGRITEYNFSMLSGKYQSEQAELDEKIERLQSAIATESQNAADAEKWIALMKECVNPAELTAELLNTLIEKIVVHEAVKGEDGSREQEVEIFYRFIGKID